MAEAGGMIRLAWRSEGVLMNEKESSSIFPEEGGRKEVLRNKCVERVRQMIEIGAQELEADQVVDGEKVFRRLKERRERMRHDVDGGE